MPGAGKSTVGVVLAKILGLQFIDTDLSIQQQSGKRLQEIIDNEGLDAFLKLESEVLSSLSCENSVIATGGSAVYSEKAMKNLTKNGIAVYLSLPLNEVKNRIDNLSTRGIAMHKGETLEDIYNSRLPLYKKYADITAECGETLENTVEIIIEKLKQYL